MTPSIIGPRFSHGRHRDGIETFRPADDDITVGLRLRQLCHAVGGEKQELLKAAGHNPALVLGGGACHHGIVRDGHPIRLGECARQHSIHLLRAERPVVLEGPRILRPGRRASRSRRVRNGASVHLGQRGRGCERGRQRARLDGTARGASGRRRCVDGQLEVLLMCAERLLLVEWWRPLLFLLKLSVRIRLREIVRQQQWLAVHSRKASFFPCRGGACGNARAAALGRRGAFGWEEARLGEELRRHKLERGRREERVDDWAGGVR
mmetsp:Transcript_22567/g.72974  ORF Transcript_22567/g.72974 Transcript_22567/m.72974 type:complete len:265 (+) Transcript_22567:447-1241(+)